MRDLVFPSPRPAALLLWLTSAAALHAVAPTAVGGPQAQTPVPIGHATEHVEVGQRYVWTAGDRTLTRVHPSRLRAAGSRRIPPPTGIAASAGALWLQTAKATWRVDEHTMSARRVAPARRGGPIAADPRTVWFADGARVRRIDPRRGRLTGAVARLPTRVGGLALGEGALWVASATRPTVWKLDAATGARLGAVGIARPGDHEDCGAPAAAISARGGTVWVAFGDTPRCPDRPPRVAAIDPASATIVGGADDPSDDLPESRPRPGALVATENGAWFARSNLSFTDGRADGPAALMSVERAGTRVAFGDDRLDWPILDARIVQESGHPRDADVSGETVWIARSGSLVRVAPRAEAGRASVAITGLRDVAAVGDRLWALTDRGLERVDTRSGRPTGVVRRVHGTRLTADAHRIWLIDGRRVSAHDPNTGVQLNWFTLTPEESALLTIGHGSAVTGSTADTPRGALFLLRQSIFTGHHTGTSGPVLPARAGGLAFDAIAAAPEGAWYVGRRAVRIDTHGRIERRQPLGGATVITAATVRAGRLWITDAEQGLLDLPQRGGRVTRRATIPAPTSLVAGERNLWILSAPTGFVDRLDLRSGRRNITPFELPELSGDVRVVATPGALWVAAPGRAGSLARITAPR